ncbi:transposase [Yinghuangia soli]|uniref:Transposase n=1 Tax=Yinghuangia soli TaxID=2908204 RepID=A0AA41U6M8_9ACTN|nr:transposase [Yinghuangia soli]MCF2533177.1 transposase [Yinghuangia soli]
MFSEIRERGYRGSRVMVTQYVATLREARERRGQDLPGWMTRACDEGPPPIQGFAATLQNDWDAVVNDCTLSWSSGAVEGQVTRIKRPTRRRRRRAPTPSRR